MFYGWWVVVACFVIWFYHGGSVVLGFTAFFEPIAQEFGWSYTQISLAASLRGAEVGMLAPLVGMVIDRWGTRRLVTIGLMLSGLGLVLMSRTNSLGMFYAAFALIALGTTGISPTVFMTVIANWFRKRVGLATGIISCGFALGGLLIPVVVRLIDVLGWRNAIFALGVGTWVIALPFSLMVRHRPEQYGLLPDGERQLPPSADRPALPVIEEVSIGVKEAVTGRAFWHITLAMMFVFLPISALQIHVMPYLSSIGIPRETSGLVASAIPLAGVLGRLSSGYLTDRYDKKKVAGVFFLMTAVGLLVFNYVTAALAWLFIPFIVFYAVGSGSNSTLRVTLMREYFGRRRFGTIFGFMMGMMALASIGGPLLAGWIYDTFGSYHATWIIFTILVFMALLIIYTLPPARNAK
ncbi:MAG: MFS transporter [Chloroflexota bacterium]